MNASPDPFEYAASIGATHELDADALKGLQQSTHRVLALMRDGRWHGSQEIIAASGIRDGLRRLRELRQLGCTVERRLVSGRNFEYRLKQNAQVQ